jgi:hypothetical protein
MSNLWIVLGNGATRIFLFRTVWRPSHDRQMTQLVIVAMAVGVGLVVAILAWRARRLQRDDPEARYRKNIQALKRIRSPRRLPPGWPSARWAAAVVVEVADAGVSEAWPA